MSSSRQPQPLQAILAELGLSRQGVTNLCPLEARVGPQTVGDIASGKKVGNDRSRWRILNAINRFEGRKKDYVWKDLYLAPPREPSEEEASPAK